MTWDVLPLPIFIPLTTPALAPLVEPRPGAKTRFLSAMVSPVFKPEQLHLSKKAGYIDNDSQPLCWAGSLLELLQATYNQLNRAASAAKKAAEPKTVDSCAVRRNA